MNALTKLSVTALLFAASPLTVHAATETEMITCKADQDQSENNIKLERLSPDMIRATGTLTAPSPAYKVAMHTRSGDLVLEFLEPNKMAPMMISAIKLDQTITVPPLNTPIGIKVEKSFNWGPNVFVCEPVMRPDY